MEQPPRSGPLFFINRFGHLRAGWRMALFAVIAVGCALGLMLALQYLRPSGGGYLGTLASDIENGLLCVALLIPSFVMLKVVDRRELGLLGLNFSRGWFKELLWGVGFGFVVICAVFLVMYAGGFVETSFNGFEATVLQAVFINYLIGFFIAGTLEEIATRGYLLQALIEGTRAWVAIVFLSLAFSLIHFRSPGFTWWAALNLFILGVLLGLTYLKTRSIWMPIGLHVAWNWTMACVWGMNVSGVTVQQSLFTSSPTGADVLSGGVFGVEGSVVTSILGALLIWYIWKAKWIKPSSFNGGLWKKYPAGYNLEPGQ